MAYQELWQRCGSSCQLEAVRVEPGLVRFSATGNERTFLQLATALAVDRVCHFAVPRPRALLGDEHFRTLVAAINDVRTLHPAEAFRTLALNAAGTDSTVLRRLHKALAQTLALTPSPAEADLLVRLRPLPGEAAGWEALIRLSPRPLSVRSWRVCDRPGALNAVVAQAMLRLTQPQPDDCFLNLCCGSGTLLIERAAYGPAARLIGCDVETAALICAHANVVASGAGHRIQLFPWDARSLPLPDATVDALCADLPFGFAVGSHSENVALYPTLLREAARVAKPGARFAILTHEVRLMETLLQQTEQWSVEEQMRLQLRTLQPALYVLQRRT
jgi:tRNA (guanine6-N2)-methyltransferase